MAGQKSPLELRFHSDPERTRRSQEESLVARATKDAQFRQQLLADPKGTLSKELGVQLPAQLKVQVLQETADTMYIVLPYAMTPPDVAKLKASADAAVVAAGNTGKTAIQFTCCC